MIAATHNVAAATFASQFEPGSEHSEYSRFISPLEALELHEEAQAEEEFHDREMDKLMSMFE